MADTAGASLSQGQLSGGEHDMLDSSRIQQHHEHEHTQRRRNSTIGSRTHPYIQTDLQHYEHAHQLSRQHSHQQLHQHTHPYQHPLQHSPIQSQPPMHGQWAVDALAQSQMHLNPQQTQTQTHSYASLKRSWGSANGPS